MATHSISMKLPQGAVLNTDIEFEIRANGAKLGEVHLSKGTIDWRPYKSKGSEYRLSWEKFAELMVANGNKHAS